MLPPSSRASLLWLLAAGCLPHLAAAWNLTVYNESACGAADTSMMVPNPVQGALGQCVQVIYSGSPRFLKNHGCNFDAGFLPRITGYDNPDCTSVDASIGTLEPTAPDQCTAWSSGNGYGIAYCSATTTTTTGSFTFTTTTTTDMPWGWPWWAWFLFCCFCLLCLGILGGAGMSGMRGMPKTAKEPEVETFTDYEVVEEPDAAVELESQPLMDVPMATAYTTGMPMATQSVPMYQTGYPSAGTQYMTYPGSAFS